MENKFCQWCSSPKNWLRWIIGAVIIMMVFCVGLATGRFSSFSRYGGQCGIERGGFQQGGYGRPMMRGGRNGRYFAPNNTNGATQTGQPAPTTDQTAPTATTTAPVK